MKDAAILRPSLLQRLFAAFAAAEKSTEHEKINARAESLLDTYGNSILRLAYSYLHNMEDAEDILQDTLIQYLRYVPEFHSAASQKAWLLQTAANLSRNRLRYNALRETDELEESLAEEGREDLSFVWDAVKQLPCPGRQVIPLYYYEGCSTAEIAGILGRRESTVRSDLRRGRQRLKEILKEAYDFETDV